MFKLKLEWTGSLDHPRFVIHNGEDQFWSGEGWTARLKQARLYHTHQDAAKEYTELAERHFDGKPVRMFEGIVRVKVYGDRAFSINDLQEFLTKGATLVMLHEAGYGPVSDSLASARILWEDLREV